MRVLCCFNTLKLSFLSLKLKDYVMCNFDIQILICKCKIEKVKFRWFSFVNIELEIKILKI